jgi:CBS domain-containing protein
MKARDIMVTPVITVEENATVRHLADILVTKRISAVPVVDSAGKLVGIVSEGDLMRRVETGTERGYSWWLRMFLGDKPIAADYVKSHSVRVGDVMTQHVVTADPETTLTEIADLFEEKGIKRVPIVSKGGDLVGIVSRANIIQAIASAQPALEISPSDTTIRQKLLDELNKQPWAHTFRLSIIVRNGIVDLWGAVGSDQERKALLVLAEAIPGVVMVNDHLIRDPIIAH